MIKTLLFILLLTTTVYAGSSVTKNWAPPAPPTVDNKQNVYDFLNFLYNHFNQVQIITTNPNGNTNAKAGEFIIYNNSGTYKICFETTQPTGTVWKCVNLS